MTVNHNISVGSSTKTVLKPVLYADIFDFPLTFEEVCTFIECQASTEQVDRWLNQAIIEGHLILQHGYYALPHRANLISTRQMRQKVTHTLWPNAIRFGLWIACLPFVKMVAVTGSLAVSNPRSNTEDIDYLVVTQPGRLWLCRALIVQLVRLGRIQEINLCPNYLITENALDFEQNLFSAREILQMKPIYGQSTYRTIRTRNQWVNHYFPQGANVDYPLPNKSLSVVQRILKRTGTFILTGIVGNLLEKQLQQIQIAKHTRRAAHLDSPDTTIFTVDVCKGHYDGHGQRTLNQYQNRVTALTGRNGVYKNGTQGD